MSDQPAEAALQLPVRAEITEQTGAELEAEKVRYTRLTDAVRRLMQATLRTTAEPSSTDAAAAEIDAIAARLEEGMQSGPLGLKVTRDGKAFGFGNAVVGARNPIALPMLIEIADERATSEFDLNPLYEGPPGMVHGGVIALVLDQVLGEAAAASGSPGMTGTLSVRYRRPTRLGRCSAAAWTDRIEGVKTIVKGEFRDADGEVTAEADGIFILPRWAREAIARGGPKPARFE